jgi:hypothetical protein
MDEERLVRDFRVRQAKPAFGGSELALFSGAAEGRIRFLGAFSDEVLYENDRYRASKQDGRK